MFSKTSNIKERCGQWFAYRAHGAGAKFWLAVLAFTESSFFLIPPDVLLVAIILTGTSRWIYYALFTAAFSVLGALVGYFIGALFFDVAGEGIISFYNLSDEFWMVQNSFNDNTFWVMLFASFTPIPYKVFVLTGGFLKVNLASFIAASALGRSARFLVVSYVVKVFRPRIVRMFFRYFNIFTYIVVALVLLWIAVKFNLLPFL